MSDTANSTASASAIDDNNNNNNGLVTRFNSFKYIPSRAVYNANNKLEIDYERSKSPIQTDTLNFSYMDIVDYDEHIEAAEETHNFNDIQYLLINNNLINRINNVNILNKLNNLLTIDLSFNQLDCIPDELNQLKNLKIFILKENQLNDKSLPKLFSTMFPQLEVVNLSGNQFQQFPYQLLDMLNLKEIYLGANKIKYLPKNYNLLVNHLELLYLGGNLIQTVPEELSQLLALKSLNLCDNRLNRLPSKLAKLKNLRNLALHNNNLTTLPIELVKLNLAELSLRNNPLVSRFVRDLNYNVPSLLELSGRSVKINSLSYRSSQLPKHLIDYLNSAQCCLNPKCRGVYFTSKVEHVKFVDFCGKYRVPLMQYLCSPKCDQRMLLPMSSESEDTEEDEVEDEDDENDGGHNGGNNSNNNNNNNGNNQERVDAAKLKRVLFG